MPVSQSLADLMAFAAETAYLAWRLTLGYFGMNLSPDFKADDSPVTVADRLAEELIRGRIEKAYPQHAIVGEEFGVTEHAGASHRWFLDPIDGTKSFIHAVPLFGTMLAVEHEGRSVLGVVLIPALDECVYAAEGQGAWHTVKGGPPRPARVSSCPRLSEGLFLTSEVANFAAVQRRDVYERLESSARLSRSWGDCFGYLMVATGRADLMVDPIMCLWDAAPVQPIIEEAGGTFTDWQGRRTIYSGQAIATNGLILDEVLAIVGQSPIGT